MRLKIFIILFSTLLCIPFLAAAQKLGTAGKPIFDEVASRGIVYFNYGTLNQFKSPLTRGTSGYFLKTNGDGTTTWASVTGSGADSSKVNTVGGDNMYGTYSLYGTLSATTSLFAKGSSATIGLENAGGTAKFLLQLAGGHANSTTYTVPSGYPSTNGQALISTTSGTMSWQTFYPGDSVPWIRNNTRSATWTRNSDNVGIGTAAPAQRLHVEGSFKLSTNIFWEHSTGSVGNLYRGTDLWLHDNKNGVFMGTGTTPASVTGTYNWCIGDYAGNSLTSGEFNLFAGPFAGTHCATGSRNVFLGPYAGHIETGSDIFIVDNRERTEANDSRYKSLLYGTFGDNTEAQFLRVNGFLDWSSQPSYPHIIVAEGERDIPNNTFAFWRDTANNRIYLLIDVEGTQYKVLLQ